MQSNIRLFIMLLCLISSTFSAQAQVSERLIGWWRMDDATNATVLADSSGNGRTATIGSGVTMVEAGRFGRAAHFDGTGNAWARLSNPTLSNMTFAAWIFMERTNNVMPRIMQVANDTYYHMPSSSPGQFNLGVRGNNWSTSAVDPFKFKTNTWFHAAVVYQQKYTNATDRIVWPTFYINGVRCGDLLPPKAFLNEIAEGTGFFLGNNWSGDIRPLEGLMDDVRLYDVPLSDKDILEIYQNRALSVDAGGDQTVHRDTTALQGRLIITNPFMRNRSSQITWSTLSAPAGDAPVIETPWLPTTAVTLPEAGDYIFRLTAITEFGTATDDVTITCETNTPPPGNTAPIVTPGASLLNTVLGVSVGLTATVTDDAIPGATRLCWSKVSGPGAVFFDNAFTNKTSATFSTNGTYIVQLQADDGALQQSAQVTVNVSLPTGDLMDGLEHVWTMNDDPALKKTFDSAGSNTLTLINQAFLQPGKTGYGYRGPTLSSVGIGSQVLTNADFMTFSAWIFFDNAYVQGANGNTYQRLYNCAPNFYILYNTTNNHLDLSTRGIGTGDTQYGWSWNTALPPNTWIHVAILFDRRPAASGLQQILYVNGQKFISGNLNTAFPGAAAFTSPFIIANTSALNGIRNFDGVLDEMRIYSRFITDEEALLLAADPDNNHAPVIEVSTSLMAKAGLATALTAQVIDDGQPAGSTLVSEWSVVSGNPAHVIFEDLSAPDSTVTFTRSGDYKLMLTASDGELHSATLVNVTVIKTGTAILVR